ncbi:unnamed protein product [Brassica rapa subsp. trilocularis]
MYIRFMHIVLQCLLRTRKASLVIPFTSLVMRLQRSHNDIGPAYKAQMEEMKKTVLSCRLQRNRASISYVSMVRTGQLTVSRQRTDLNVWTAVL